METNPKTASPSKPTRVMLFFRWLFLVVGAVAVFITGYELALFLAYHSTHVPQSRTEAFVYILVHIIAVAFILALVVPILRRVLRRTQWINRLWASLFTWRTARRLSVGAAVLATLMAAFYAEENWRGRRAWEKRKRELTAKGEVLDWNAYIPQPIPDNENIMKAPRMAEWFVRPKPGANLTNKLNLGPTSRPFFRKTKETNLLAQVVVVQANSSATSGSDVLVRLDAPDAPERLREVFQNTIGPYTITPQGFGVILRQPLLQIKPGRVLLQADTPPTPADMSRLLPTNSILADLGGVRVEADVQKDSFRILLAVNRTMSAEECLTDSDRFVPELDLIREALKRPRIRMEGDYQRPFEMPIVNFVTVRTVAQVAAQRAQCCLLLGRSEQAFRELSLIFELRRLLAAKPTTLVAAMIDVAVSGLYVQTIADGFRLQAWREPERIALQSQLQQINLLPAVVDSFRGERAAVCRTLETASARQIGGLFSLSNPPVSAWEKLTNPTFLLFKFGPRGWVYQNLALLASVKQTAIEAYDTERQIIKPGVPEAATREIQRLADHRSPYNILAAMALPNFERATQTTARNQTWVNEAFIVCGLERYRLIHGGYPESLDALVPQFVEKLPPDVIGGQPLHYRRTPDGKFLLYSVGWNEKDDGGESSTDREKGDWVWPPDTR